MSISSQLPPIPLAQASAMLRALAQMAGQTVEAKVLAQAANGTAQVQIGRQQLSLTIPTAVQVGSTLSIAVQQVEGELRLTLVTAPPSGNAGAVAAPQNAASGQAATSIQLSPAALAATGPSQPAVAMPAEPASGAAPRVAPAPVAATASGPVLGPVAGGGVQNAGAGQAMLTPSAATASATPAATTVTSPMAAAPVIASAPRVAIPYAVAAPTSGAAQLASIAGAATTSVLPPIGPSTPSTTTSQHAPVPNPPVAAQGAAAIPAAPQPAATPQAALAQMVQQALPRQDSILGLTTALAGIVGRVALPEPVLKAAQQVLAQRLNLDGKLPDGVALKQAMRGSGIFQEAMLASGAAKAAGTEMKTALLGLQRQLGAWLGDQAQVEQVHTIPPPMKGMPPRARQPVGPQASLPDEPELAGKVLLDRTEAALARLRLHQNASLPEPVAHRSEAQWSLDLPVVIAGQQNVLQMQIHRDAGRDDTPSEERGWQVRFAIHFGEAGEVGAQIALRGQTTRVLLWADRAETAEMLNENIDALRDGLAAIGLVPGAIVVRNGAPVSAVVPSGHVVDAVR